MMRIALFQPDIAQNTGTILRLAACFGLTTDIIEPAGFAWSAAKFRRAGMDYLDAAKIIRHADYDVFDSQRRAQNQRLVLASTRGSVPHTQFEFGVNDVLMFGRESAGVPDHVHDDAEARVLIPMQPGMRSINVALSAAIIVGEALRQTGAMDRLAQQAG